MDIGILRLAYAMWEVGLRVSKQKKLSSSCSKLNMERSVIQAMAGWRGKGRIYSLETISRFIVQSFSGALFLMLRMIWIEC
jgi:hypothetical protein